MNDIKVHIADAAPIVTADTVSHIEAELSAAVKTLHDRSGAGNDFLGWLDLPQRTTPALLDQIDDSARILRNSCDTVVCIGIGGSYLGAKAVIEAMAPTFDSLRPGTVGNPKVLFAGQNIGEDYLADLCDYLQGRSFGIIVISKSGTTTEPAIAFRILRAQLEKAVGRKEAANRIVAVTDASRGALRKLADDEGYRTFVIEDAVGGRFSVLSPVGLLPVAVAGYDIHALIAGALDMQQHTQQPVDNPAELYAAARNLLYRAGKKTEILVNYNPRLHYFAEWWKQLYGESEGKDHKGIFPAAVDNSTDLHSMGQWIQDGERTVFETVLSVENVDRTMVIPEDTDNLDGLNYIAGKRVDRVNKMAELGTRLAHVDGGVPNLRITIPAINERSLGQLIYFFEKACGISGYLLGVNPFDQPGVEAYKKNMFALLEKPGHEEATARIKARLNG